MFGLFFGVSIAERVFIGPVRARKAKIAALHNHLERAWKRDLSIGASADTLPHAHYHDARVLRRRALEAMFEIKSGFHDQRSTRDIITAVTSASSPPVGTVTCLKRNPVLPTSHEALKALDLDCACTGKQINL